MAIEYNKDFQALINQMDAKDLFQIICDATSILYAKKANHNGLEIYTTNRDDMLCIDLIAYSNPDYQKNYEAIVLQNTRYELIGVLRCILSQYQ